MKYDLSKCHTGPCQNCKMRGILYRKPFVKTRMLVDEPVAENLPVMTLCISCFETPAGMVSENLRHERLPAEGYLKR